MKVFHPVVLAQVMQVLVIFGVAAVAGVVVYVLGFKGLDALMADSQATFGAIERSWDFSHSARGLFIAISAVQTFALIVALFYTYSFLGFLKRREALTAGALQAVRKCGEAILTLEVLGILSTPGYSFALSLDAPAGQRNVSVQFELTDIWMIVAAGVLMLIGAALHDAIEVVEENKSFV